MNILFILLITSIMAMSSYADEYSHNCARPIKPINMTENRDIKKYNTDNRNYYSCMMSFIDKHKALTKLHNDATRTAIEEWNSFSGAKKKESNSRKFTGSQGVSQGGNHTVGHSDPYKISTGFKF